MPSTKEVLLALLAAWAVYNVWRVIVSRGNAVEVAAETVTNVPVQAAFAQYMKVREYYLDLSPGHRKYEIVAGTSPADMVIEVWETAGFQFVKHRYRIAGLVPDERMNLVSEASEVRVLGLFRGVTRSEVEFRFQPEGEARTRLGITIRIVFPNGFRQLLARLFFTEAIWRRHARQEMAALGRIIERRCAASGPGEDERGGAPAYARTFT